MLAYFLDVQMTRTQVLAKVCMHKSTDRLCWVYWGYGIIQMSLSESKRVQVGAPLQLILLSNFSWPDVYDGEVTYHIHMSSLARASRSPEVHIVKSFATKSRSPAKLW